MTILVCDDDHDIVEALEIYLRGEGYDVLTAANGAEALRKLEAHEVHLLLLDVMMPVMDGLRALMELRRRWNVPVILLTAKSEEADKVLGLNIGADDYVTKPFSPLELIARVKSQLRRYTALGSVVARSGLYRTGGLAVDDERKEVTVDGEPVRLTPVEYGILCLLTVSFPSTKSTSRCGGSRPSARRTPSPCTSAASGRRSRSTQRNPNT